MNFGPWVKNSIFFYHYKIYFKNYGIRQFSGSIIQNKFWLRRPKFKSESMGYIWICVVRFETGMVQIRNLHGSYSELAHFTRFLAWAKKRDFRVILATFPSVKLTSSPPYIGKLQVKLCLKSLTCNLIFLRKQKRNVKIKCKK